MQIALHAGRVILKGGQVACTCCCPTGAPTFQWDTSTASLSKCGVIDFTGDPNQFFRKKTVCDAGLKKVLLFDGNCDATETGGCSADCNTGLFFLHEGIYYKKKTTTRTCSVREPNLTADLTIVESVTWVPAGPGVTGCFETITKIESGTCTSSGNPGGGPGAEFSCVSTYNTVTESWEGTFSLSGSDPVSIDHPCYDGPWDCDEDVVYSEPVTPFEGPVFEDEYTTPQLKTNTRAALPGLDGDWDDTPGLLYFLTADERTFNLRDGLARIAVADMGLVVGQTYRAYYFWRSTPLPSGAPSDGEELYVEFTFAEGMESVEVPMPEFPTANIEMVTVGVRWECGPFGET